MAVLKGRRGVFSDLGEQEVVAKEHLRAADHQQQRRQPPE